jgi:hypothetical protein
MFVTVNSKRSVSRSGLGSRIKSTSMTRTRRYTKSNSLTVKVSWTPREHTWNYLNVKRYRRISHSKSLTK